ncbi:hypothetical protein [Lysobacter enzymogenes]|uniref:hypothetical protein n=1 Tax=Lysobacter enzymogenes TaxID=69 RepID=UPI001AF6B8C5|nr:hypothetical protein [Lysobacter enzymogenes]QQP99239.1 hypothetical protein JHW41_14000 [Lysobacter enzymogenes]
MRNDDATPRHATPRYSHARIAPTNSESGFRFRERKADDDFNRNRFRARRTPGARIARASRIVAPAPPRRLARPRKITAFLGFFALCVECAMRCQALDLANKNFRFVADAKPLTFPESHRQTTYGRTVFRNPRVARCRPPRMHAQGAHSEPANAKVSFRVRKRQAKAGAKRRLTQRQLSGHRGGRAARRHGNTQR